jgi:chemotaxis protein MotB
MSRKKHAEHEKEPNQERWLLTYADLITLLMIFFVVMYALSSADTAKFQALSTSLRFVFGGGGSLIGTSPGPGLISVPLESESGMDVVLEEFEKHLAQAGSAAGSGAQYEDRGLVLTLQEKMLFEPGRADITPQAGAQLKMLARILNLVNNYVRVEGHTDNAPVAGAFRSNWQLSTQRAANIAEFLVREGGVRPQRLAAAGYGEYRPIADNREREGRAKNRRVEVILLNKKFDATERNAR